MTVLAHQHHMSDDTAARLRTTIAALHRGGEPVEEAMKYAERVCAAANCEFDPDGIDIVTEVYGGRYDGARIVGAVPYVDATPSVLDTVDAVPEDSTPGNVLDDTVVIDTRVELDESEAEPVATTAPSKSAKKK